LGESSLLNVTLLPSLIISVFSIMATCYTYNSLYWFLSNETQIQSGKCSFSTRPLSFVNQVFYSSTTFGRASRLLLNRLFQCEFLVNWISKLSLFPWWFITLLSELYMYFFFGQFYGAQVRHILYYAQVGFYYWINKSHNWKKKEIWCDLSIQWWKIHLCILDKDFFFILLVIVMIKIN
jgi:hypothetical protein